MGRGGVGGDGYEEEAPWMGNPLLMFKAPLGAGIECYVP
jgi:hypothetical protein